MTMSEVDKISALGSAAIERSRERRRPIGTKSVALRRQHLFRKMGRVLIAGGVVLLGAALFGALGVVFVSKNWKIAVAPIVVMVALFLFVPSLASAVGILVPVGALIAIGVARVLYKKNLL